MQLLPVFYKGSGCARQNEPLSPAAPLGFNCRELGSLGSPPRAALDAFLLPGEQEVKSSAREEASRTLNPKPC